MNAPDGVDASHRPPAFAEAARFWCLLGVISFGGPAGQIAMMHGELVDRRRWIGEQTFVRALNFCMLLPGPEAMQLATWMGWRLHGLRGGLFAGTMFVLPGAFAMAVLAWLYLRYQQLPLMQGAMFGLQAAVLGIVVHAAQRIGTRVLGTRFAVAVAALALVAIALGVPFPLVVLAAALAGLWARRRPGWLPMHADGSGGHVATAARDVRHALATGFAVLTAWWLPLLVIGAWLGRDSTAFAMGLFFSKAALLTLGGAYAVLPYVAQQAVEVQGWLDSGQMMTGLGLAETTPGPLILVLEFVGFAGGWQHSDIGSPLAGALLGTAVTLWATFLPSFLFVLTAAPWIERIGRWPRANAMLAAVTAAVVGVIVHLALWFGWRLLQGTSMRGTVVALAIATVAYFGLARGRWPMAAVVAGAALGGVLAQAFGIMAGPEIVAPPDIIASPSP